MTDEEFNNLINGPLRHPYPMFTIMRLQMALRHVIDATGEAGSEALRQNCREREVDDPS